jgi:hypothetical protein
VIHLRSGDGPQRLSLTPCPSVKLPPYQGSWMAQQHDTRRLPTPWSVELIPGGFKVLDANGQPLAYVYARDKSDADIAKVLTWDEARRIASNVAKLPELLAKKRAGRSMTRASRFST